MRAEVISIGDEMTSGQRLDTNSQWLSLRLGEAGVTAAFHTTVGDDLDDNLRAFREAVDRADVVVASGGLGPTADDLTREVLARLVERPLVEDPAALAHIRGLFARRGRPMPERNRVQALFPEGSRVIPNPQGTAPGVALDVPRPGREPARVFALPGVPAEMREMWAGSVAPALAALPGPRSVILHRRIKCFGVGESDLEQMLPDLIRRGREPSVGITVSEATITLRITARAASLDAARAAIEPTARTIYDCLGELVFGEEEDELPQAVARQLAQRGQSLATVEWGTGGLLVRWLSEAATEATYKGGLVVRGATALARGLGIEPALLAEHGPASGAAARAMAEAVRERFAADVGLAVGAFPEREPGGEPPAFHYALTDRDGTRVKSASLAGHSAILLPRAAKQALNLLRLGK